MELNEDTPRVLIIADSLRPTHPVLILATTTEPLFVGLPCLAHPGKGGTCLGDSILESE